MERTGKQKLEIGKSNLEIENWRRNSVQSEPVSIFQFLISNPQFLFSKAQFGQHRRGAALPHSLRLIAEVRQIS